MEPGAEGQPTGRPLRTRLVNAAKNRSSESIDGLTVPPSMNDALPNARCAIPIPMSATPQISANAASALTGPDLRFELMGPP